MAEDFGSGVSRTLSAFMRQFQGVIAQANMPPLDSDYNLVSQIHQETIRQTIQAEMPSGFLADPVRALDDYEFNPLWANFFKLGYPKTGELQPVVLANINGWILPITGTDVTSDADLANWIKLYPAPMTDMRIDLIFLEAWQVIVRANPATEHKPSADKIWKFGNTMFGGTNISDDISDPTLGFAASKRLQVQYRIRKYGQGSGLGAGVALDIYPDGLGDPNVLGQGSAAAPIGGFSFSNMRAALNDPSLWRAGDGDPNNSLGTVDGFTYAIPICAVFRRNSSTFVAVNQSGNPNQNGAFERTPSAKTLPNPLDGAKVLTQASLVSYLGPDTTGVVQVNDLIGSGIDDTSHVLTNLFLIIDDEIIGISAIDTVVSPPTITIPTGGRGRNGTHATGHQAATDIYFYNTRADGLFADEVAQQDLLDLRRSVTPGQWDYENLLLHNLGALTSNKLRSTFKASGIGDTEGVSVVEVDYLLADGTVAQPNHTEVLDGPDGIRTIFSDAAAPQPDVTVMCDNDALLNQGFTVDQFDTNVSWDVGADFKPTGFMNNEGATGAWRNGSQIFLHIGGTTGDEGARATFRDGTTRAVRFLSPREWWKERGATGRQAPVTMRFIDQYALMPDAPGEGAAVKHPGPMYPWYALDYANPFIVLGGILHPSLRLSGIAANTDLINGPPFEIDVGLDFDVSGGFYTKTGASFNNNPSLVTTPFLRGQRTLYGMLTNNGRDRTGSSSDVYLNMWGDPSAGSRGNNGIFKVLGAGTVGYTSNDATNSTSIVVQPLSSDFTNFNTASAETLQAEIRSMVTNSEDGEGYTSGPAALVVGITDIEGLWEDGNPWNRDTLGFGTPEDYSIPSSVESKLVLNLTLQYHPSRGGTARISDEVWRTSVISPSGSGTFLRQPDSLRDPTFPSEAGTPVSEVFYDPAHIQVWNRLPSKGLDAPFAEGYGGNVVGWSEQDREHELFYDRGSKTIFFRPFQDMEMTIKSHITVASPDLLGGATYPVGSVLAGVPRDGAQIFSPQRTLAFPVPPEWMPRFGRQDIPYYVDVGDDTNKGQGNYLEGINHLFVDATDATKPVFYVVGGEDNTTGGNLVKPMYFQTGSTSGHAYAHWGTITGGPLNQPAYQARLTTDIGSLTSNAKELTNRLREIRSSDLGNVFRGIQLPPYLGIARLYGVYDRADYITQSGRTYQSDRVTPDTTPRATNLLRRDVTQQSLFIFQDGALDQTNEYGDHTYIIPENAIDITRSPNYTPGDLFTDFEYVVECEVFGFARYWINHNNYVMARRHTGAGVFIDETAIVTPPEIEGVHMVIPTPAPINQPMYVGYNRTVYQGDPYMTRAGNVRTTSDYEHRYGQVPLASARQLSTTIQQYNINGVLQVETPNVRPLEILATVDFYTTLGTGNVGGNLLEGTVLDVGHIENSPDAVDRIPDSTVPWRVLPRTFTLSQRDNPNRAWVDLNFFRLDHVENLDDILTITAPDGTPYSFTFKDSSTYVPANIGDVMLDNLLYLVDVHGAVVVPAHDISFWPVPLTGTRSQDTVVVNQEEKPAGLVVEGIADPSSSDIVIVRLTNTTPNPIPVDVQPYIIRVFDKDTDVHNPSDVRPKAISPQDVQVNTARNFADRINRHPSLRDFVEAIFDESQTVRLVSKIPGDVGNQIKVTLGFGLEESIKITTAPAPGDNQLGATVNEAYLAGGQDQRVNAGVGQSPVTFTGVTERLPLGILIQDADFLGENIADPVGSMQVGVPTATIRPIQLLIMPLTAQGQEYTPSLGTPGEILAMADGGILQYVAYHDVDRPLGTKKFRLFRGGGSVFQLSGDNPGGPVMWIADAPQDIFAKGGILSCRALLVRNFYEEAFSTNTKVSDGDEIQMLILTSAVFATPQQLETLTQTLLGQNSPTEWGKGTTAVDRYRLNGKPMVRKFSRQVRSPVGIPLAPYDPTS